MDYFITVIFDTEHAAFEGLHALWKLDGGDSAITIRGAAVIQCDAAGLLNVVLRRTDSEARTTVAATFKSMSQDSVLADELVGVASAQAIMKPGQSAVIADAWEEDVALVDASMKLLRGVVLRHNGGSADDDRVPDLFPYDYE